MNSIKVFVLLVIMTLFFLWIGHFLFGYVGIVLALFLMMIIDISAYFYSDKSALRFSGAREMESHELVRLVPLLKSVADQAKIAPPKLYLIDSDASNVLAVGKNPNNAGIAVTAGLIQLLNDEEIKAIFAVEVSLIAARDTFLGAVTASVAGGFSNLANLSVWRSLFGLKNSDDTKINGAMMCVVGPISAVIVRILISKNRIFRADQAAIRLLDNPLSLLSALEKINTEVGVVFLRVQAYPAIAHLFFINPLSNKRLRTWFSTFPDIAERISKIGIK